MTKNSAAAAARHTELLSISDGIATVEVAQVPAAPLRRIGGGKTALPWIGYAQRIRRRSIAATQVPWPASRSFPIPIA
ncbi:hypothetical protein ACVDG5_001215 [Mesorhizobium sp. ORM6]